MIRMVLVLVVCVPLYAEMQRSERQLYGPVLAIPVGARSGDTVLADINRDGHVDLVTAHPPKETLSLRFGKGIGRFSADADHSMTLPNRAGAIAIGDLNRDNVLDLVVASKDDRREYVNVFPGDGRGRFDVAATSQYAVATAFAYYKPVLQLVDIDEDGHVDIVSANARRNSIEILFGDGRGRFSLAPPVPLSGAADFYSFGLADVDGDAHLDLVSANSMGERSDRVVVKSGNGRGAFAEPTPVAATRRGARVAAVSDVNGDKSPDIVVAHFEDDHLSVVLNTGAGTFSHAPGSPYRLADEAFDVIVVDVNRDGRPDLLAATVNSTVAPYSGSLTVLVGGDRGLLPAPGSPYRVGPGAYNIAVGDVNEDGRLDVAASSFESDSMALLPGR